MPQELHPFIHILDLHLKLFNKRIAFKHELVRALQSKLSLPFIDLHWLLLILLHLKLIILVIKHVLLGFNGLWNMLIDKSRELLGATSLSRSSTACHLVNTLFHLDFFFNFFFALFVHFLLFEFFF